MAVEIMACQDFDLVIDFESDVPLVLDGKRRSPPPGLWSERRHGRTVDGYSPRGPKFRLQEFARGGVSEARDRVVDSEDAKSDFHSRGKSGH